MTKRGKELVKEIWRKPFTYSMRKKLRIKNARIISSMCVGGILYHDLGLQFLSPTINMIIPKFVDFCEELEETLLKPIEFLCYDSKNEYPIAKIDDYIIHGMHYKNFGELKEQWERRCRRFFSSTEEIVLMATDAQVKMKDIDKFHQLPFRKVCFTSKSDIPYEEFVYIPDFEGETEVGDILRYKNIWGTRMFEKYFDCVGWPNNEKK